MHIPQSLDLLFPHRYKIAASSDTSSAAHHIHLYIKIANHSEKEKRKKNRDDILTHRVFKKSVKYLSPSSQLASETPHPWALAS